MRQHRFLTLVFVLAAAFGVQSLVGDRKSVV